MHECHPSVTILHQEVRCEKLNINIFGLTEVMNRYKIAVHGRNTKNISAKFLVGDLKCAALVWVMYKPDPSPMTILSGPMYTKANGRSERSEVTW